MERMERDGLRRMRWPRRMSRLPSRVWSDDDWQRIQLGYGAGAMEEKWNVFTEGQVVFCHRSWTGTGYFEATFAPVEGGGWRIATGKVARDRGDLVRRLRPGGRRYSDELHVVLLELVLSAIVLGEPAQELRKRLDQVVRSRVPDPKNVPDGLIAHVYLGQRSE
jgi:hypothetical protein